MRRVIAGLLPCLAASAVLGVLAADRGWLGGAAAGWVALASTGVGLAARRRPLVVGVCAAAAIAALGAASHAERLAIAARAAPESTVDAAVDGTVRALRRERTWVAAELHDVVSVPFGEMSRASVPARLEWVESMDTPEGVWLAARAEGERIRARVRLQPGGGLRNPGAVDRSATRRRRGIGAEARLVDARLAMRLVESPVPSIRRGLACRLLQAGTGGELLAALAVGDRSGLDPEAREAFRRLGIGHLLAVSGLHLALVAALGFAVVRCCALRIGFLAETTDARMWACAGAGLAAVGYALLAGWGVPVRRAMVLVLVSLVALGLRRRSAPVHALSAAGLWIALRDSSAVFGLGPQLSFVATGALLLDRRPAEGRLAAGLRVSSTVIAAGAPVLAAHGVSSTPAGLLANLVAVPWTAVVLLPAALVAAGLAALEPSAWIDGGLGACAWIGKLSLEVVLGAAAWLPAQPAAPVSGPGVMLVTGVACASLRARRTRARFLLAALASSAAALAPAAIPGPEPPRVVVFDVGQGDAILVEGREGAILVDGGWAMPGGADLGRSAVLPALEALGVARLDLLVATHADLDHRGGLPSLLEALPVGEVWLPAGRREELEELLAAAARRGVVVREQHARPGSARVGDLEVEVLWPPPDDRGRSRNDSSLVLRISVAGTRILLTGDIGESAERGLLASQVDLRADVLKLPHHGSRTSATLPFLEAVDPEIGLLSAPCSARRRLPTSEVFERARRVGLPLWWTGRDGALWVEIRDAPVRRAVWGWQRDPHCREPASRPAPRRT